MVYIFVEGNVGSGKSSFLKNIQQLKNRVIRDAVIVEEPVDEWKKTVDSEGINILEHFYKDIKGFCYQFQSFAFISRINQLDSCDENNINFIERSVFCDKNVFAKTCKDCGNMSEMEWIIYNKWFEWMIKKYSNVFDNAIYLYLRCSPQTSLARIRKRNRPEEQNITLEYIENLHNAHELWLMNNSQNTIVIDAEKDLTNMSILSTVINSFIFSISNKIPQYIDDIPNNTPKDSPEDTSEDTSDYIPNNIPEDSPDDTQPIDWKKMYLESLEVYKKKSVQNKNTTKLL